MVRISKEVLGGFVGIVASFFAASCCIVPTLFVVFGVSASWLSFLDAFEPYRNLFLLVGYAAVGYSVYEFHLKRKNVECACEEGFLRKFSRNMVWIALLLLLIATFYPYILSRVYEGS